MLWVISSTAMCRRSSGEVLGAMGFPWRLLAVTASPTHKKHPALDRALVSTA